MKFKALLFAFAMAFAGTAFSQSSEMPSKEQIRAQATELTMEMTPVLDLNDNQVERMKGLNYMTLAHVAKYNSTDMSEADKSKELNAFMEKQEKTIAQILSKEQMAKYRESYREKLYNFGQVSSEK
jgi:hypothetical protein